MATKRLSTNRRKSDPGDGGIAGKLVLYPLALIGALYLGMQAWSAYRAPSGPPPKGGSPPSRTGARLARSLDPDRTASADTDEQERGAGARAPRKIEEPSREPAEKARDADEKRRSGRRSPPHGEESSHNPDAESDEGPGRKADIPSGPSPVSGGPAGPSRSAPQPLSIAGAPGTSALDQRPMASEPPSRGKTGTGRSDETRPGGEGAGPKVTGGGTDSRSTPAVPRGPVGNAPRAVELPAQPQPSIGGPRTDPPRGDAPRVETPRLRPDVKTAFKALPPVEIDRGVARRHEVALTFDAGSDYRPVRKILETLAKDGTKCTFFLTGEWVQRNPKSTKRIAAEGHEFGNHSWNHPAFTGLSGPEIEDQLTRTEAIIQETAGKSTRPYFRPPLGARDSRVRKAVGSQGFLTVYWTLDSHDSVEKGITAEQIRDRVLGKITPGSIVLMHCGSQASADALSDILEGLKAKGLRPVTVSQLLAE
jgi:peptidoglycan/xylan/chitin deacetylase (PgdA/CDA1 family)